MFKLCQYYGESDTPCHKPTKPLSSYCADHHAVVYRKTSKQLKPGPTEYYIKRRALRLANNEDDFR